MRHQRLGPMDCRYMPFRSIRHAQAPDEASQKGAVLGASCMISTVGLG